MFETDNPFFSAGLSLSLMGVGLAGLRQSTFLLSSILKKRYTMSLEVTNRDRCFDWVLMNVQKSKDFDSNHLTVKTANNSSRDFKLTPCPGTHIMKIGGKFMLVNRIRETSTISSSSGSPFESVKFTTYGNNKKILMDILTESRANALVQNKNKTTILRSMMFNWEYFGAPRTKRPLNSVILAKNIKNDIINDIVKFKEAKDWYIDKGIPYRRSYLLHGPPGTGKTSFITALAGHFDYDIASISLTENIKDDQFAILMRTVPQNAFVLIEDIDAIFEKQKIAPDGFRMGVTFSGLLNVLDGVMSTEKRITFLTTNHIDKLDKALIRPGRVDVIQKIDESTESQGEEVFLKYFPKEKEKARDFGRKSKGKSMAHLQGVLLKNRKDPVEALRAINMNKR